MTDWVTAEDEAEATITVQVIPRAHRSEIVGVQGGALKVRISAPPVEGAANETLIEFLANTLGLRKRDIELLSGERSRRKRLRIRGLGAESIAARLLPGRTIVWQ